MKISPIKFRTSEQIFIFWISKMFQISGSPTVKFIHVPENPGFGKYPSPWPPNVIHFSLLAVCCCNCGRYIIELLSVLRIGASYFQSANIPKFIALGPNLHLFVKKFQICSQEIFLEFLSLFDLVRICVRSVMVRRIFLG